MNQFAKKGLGLILTPLKASPIAKFWFKLFDLPSLSNTNGDILKEQLQYLGNTQSPTCGWKRT